MKYLVMEGRYNYDPANADPMFATSDEREAVEAAKDFGGGMVVVSVDVRGDKKKIFIAPYNTHLGVME